MRTRPLRRAAVALSVAILCGPAWQSDAAPTRSGTVAGPASRVDLKGGRLSAHLDRVPLEKVLLMLSERSGLSFTLQGRVGEELVAAQFDGLPLEEGLRRLLVGREFAILYDRRGRQSSLDGGLRVREVVIFSPNGGAGTASQGGTGTFSQQRASALPTLMRDAQGAADPSDRVRALEQLANRAEEAELSPVLSRALQDEAPEVRDLAMTLLEDLEESFPFATVADLAVRDDEPRLRAKALTLLAQRTGPRATESLKAALEDPDSRVRARAADLLDDLGIEAGLEPVEQLDADHEE